MRARLFDGVPVSEIGLGCWQIGGGFGAIPETQALATLDAAADAGVTFFDTADVYGESETLIGKFLRGRRDGAFVATKLGRKGNPELGDLSESFVRAATESSLRRLGVDTLDLTQLHCVPPRVLERADVWGWLARLRDEGKIRRFGASVETVDEALLCLRQPGLASLQIIFNVFRQKAVTTLFAAARARGVALIVRLPLASGLLSGRHTKGERFADDDHRNFNRDGAHFNVGETFSGLPFETAVALADGLKPLVPPHFTMANMALRYCLDFDAVTVVIPGAKSPEQVRANTAASDRPPLGEALHRQLADFYREKVARHIRGGV